MWAVLEIGVLFVMVIATMLRFNRVSPTAAWLLLPYAAWVAYAASLTIGIAVMN